MRTHACWRIIFCAVLVVLLSGCDALRHAAQYTVEDAQDAITEIRGVHTIRLGRWTDDVPAQTRLVVDMADDKVYVSNGNSEQLLGELTYQLPDTPIKTMFLDTGEDKFVLGRVDNSVPGHVVSVTLDAYESPEAASFTRVPGKTSMVNSRGYYFFIPFYHEEIQAWQRLGYLYISTRESLQKVLNGELALPFEITYEPYFEIMQYQTLITIK